MFEDLLEILTRYGEVMLQGTALQMAVCALLFAAVKAWGHRIGSGLLFLFAFGFGLSEVWRQRAIFDDAYISFRYVRNLLDGNGWVFNHGEFVEGYTNPLWSLMVAATTWVSGVEIPLAAVALNFAVYVGVVGAAVWAGRQLRPEGPWLPFAAILLAGQMSITAYATTGMETLFGALLVLVGAAMLTVQTPVRLVMSGLILTLAVIHRLDHAVFFCAGVGAVGVQALWKRDVKEGGRNLVLYSAPLVLLVVYFAWKISYYGDILPNTFYAKGGDAFRVDQGVVYIATFLIGSHTWMLAPVLLVFVYLGVEEDRTRPIVVFTALATTVWALYLMKVGGDFMYSRFCIPLLPLMLVLAEVGVRSVAGPKGIALAAVLGATFGGAPIIPPKGLHHWGQANENGVYELIGFNPIVISHSAFRHGQFFDEVLTQRGITVQMGTCCVGMWGYYSQQPMMDFHGLTDAQVAHKPIPKRRGRLPGHEKRATSKEIRDRGVRIARWGDKDPERFRELTRITVPRGRRLRQNSLSVVTWDDALMKRLKREVPEMKFTDFPRWLDGYLGRMEFMSLSEVEADLAWFKGYYFDHTPDPKRLKKLEDFLAAPERILEPHALTLNEKPLPARVEGAHTIALVGHPYGFEKDQKRGRPGRNLVASVDAINAAEPSLVVFLGDNVGRPEWPDVRALRSEVADRIDAPVVALPGNHDLLRGASRFPAMQGPLFQRIDLGRELVVILNSGGADTEFDGAQKRFFQETLRFIEANERIRNIVVLFHKVVFSTKSRFAPIRRRINRHYKTTFYAKIRMPLQDLAKTRGVWVGAGDVGHKGYSFFYDHAPDGIHYFATGLADLPHDSWAKLVFDEDGTVRIEAVSATSEPLKPEMSTLAGYPKFKVKR